MLLSINPLLPEISFIIIDGYDIIEQSTITKNLDTASTFPRHVVDIMNRHKIDEVWCITGPGPFTLMRIVTLTCNAIRLTRWIKLKWCHFFDMIGWSNTPILEANPRECIIRFSWGDILIPRIELPDGIYIWILETKDFTEGKTFIQYTEDAREIIKVFQHREYIQNLSPLYFKAPHITWSNKKTSLSSETVNIS